MKVNISYDSNQISHNIIETIQAKLDYVLNILDGELTLDIRLINFEPDEEDFGKVGTKYSLVEPTFQIDKTGEFCFEFNNYDLLQDVFIKEFSKELGACILESIITSSLPGEQVSGLIEELIK